MGMTLSCFRGAAGKYELREVRGQGPQSMARREEVPPEPAHSGTSPVDRLCKAGQMAGGLGLPVLSLAALQAALADLKEPVSVLSVSSILEAAAAAAACDTLHSSVGSIAARTASTLDVALAVRCDSESGQASLVLSTEQGSTSVGCVLTNATAVDELQLRDEQDILNFLARRCAKDPSLKALLHDVIERLLHNQLSTVSHFVPGDFGRDRYFLSMRITPFAYQRPAMGGPGDISTSGGGGFVPALILELNVPYEGKELASRLQRDYMIMSNIPSIVTMFDMDGRVLHQNRSSVAYMGYLVGMDTAGAASEGRAAGRTGGSDCTATPPLGANRLQQLFSLDPTRLQGVMQAVSQGMEWRGVVRMAPRFLDGELGPEGSMHDTHGTYGPGDAGDRAASSVAAGPSSVGQLGSPRGSVGQAWEALAGASKDSSEPELAAKARRSGANVAMGLVPSGLATVAEAASGSGGSSLEGSGIRVSGSIDGSGNGGGSSGQPGLELLRTVSSSAAAADAATGAAMIAPTRANAVRRVQSFEVGESASTSVPMNLSEVRSIVSMLQSGAAGEVLATAPRRTAGGIPASGLAGRAAGPDAEFLSSRGPGSSETAGELTAAGLFAGSGSGSHQKLLLRIAPQAAVGPRLAPRSGSNTPRTFANSLLLASDGLHEESASSLETTRENTEFSIEFHRGSRSTPASQQQQQPFLSFIDEVEERAEQEEISFNLPKLQQLQVDSGLPSPFATKRMSLGSTHAFLDNKPLLVVGPPTDLREPSAPPASPSGANAAQHIGAQCMEISSPSQHSSPVGGQPTLPTVPAAARSQQSASQWSGSQQQQQQHSAAFWRNDTVVRRPPMATVSSASLQASSLALAASSSASILGVLPWRSSSTTLGSQHSAMLSVGGLTIATATTTATSLPWRQNSNPWSNPSGGPSRRMSSASGTVSRQGFSSNSGALPQAFSGSGAGGPRATSYLRHTSLEEDKRLQALLAGLVSGDSVMGGPRSSAGSKDTAREAGVPTKTRSNPNFEATSVVTEVDGEMVRQTSWHTEPISKVEEAPHGSLGAGPKLLIPLAYGERGALGAVAQSLGLAAAAMQATEASPTGAASRRQQQHGQRVGTQASTGRWHEVHVKPCNDPLSEVPLIMVIQTDVTSKVHAEERLARVLEAEHRLLADIFPSHVVRHMTQRRRDEAELERNGLVLLRHLQDPAALATSHECITVLFSDIKGFTEMSKEVAPAVVMTFLNDLYTRFDSLTDVYGVYKVETIGDCYMCAGGLVARDEDGYGRAVRGQGDTDPLHAVRVVAFARAMLEEAAKVLLPSTGEPVKMRVGIHSGPATSGVVGHKMPRFCLFGDTINTASRMESTGQPGAIHVSSATRSLLHPEEDQEGWAATGGVEVKGKGRMDTFVWCSETEDAHRQRRSKQRRANMLGTLSSLSIPSSPPASSRLNSGPRSPAGNSPAPVVPVGKRNSANRKDMWTFTSAE